MCVCVRARARACACVRVCVRACVRACVCVFNIYIYIYICYEIFVFLQRSYVNKLRGIFHASVKMQVLVSH